MRLLALLPLLSAVVPAVAWQFDEYYGYKCEDGTHIPKSHRVGTTGWGCNQARDPTAKRLLFKDAKGYKFTFYKDSKCSEYASELVSPDDGCHSEGETFLNTAYRVDPV